MQQPVAQLPWSHNIVLLQKLDEPAARLWYAQSAAAHGWSRKLLEHHIATRRYAGEGKALTNFADTLPAPEGELAQQIVHVARYALGGINRPVDVARYTSTPLVEQVPEELHDQLPELEQISAGVQRIVARHADEVAEAEGDLARA